MQTHQPTLRLVAAGTEGASALLAIGIARAGMWKGSRACSFLVTWAIAERRLGHDLGSEDTGSLSAAIREHAKYWRQSERTSWRDLTAWQASFPSEESPAELAHQLLDVYDLELSKRTDALGAAAGVMVIAA